MTKQKPRAVVIGASAGAMEALYAILPALPVNYPLPVMVVVHLPPDKESMLPGLLQTRCKMPVHEAEDKEEITPGKIYLAPPDYHLLVERDQTLSLSNDDAVLFSRPSIDVLFETAADVYETGLTGVILTGASSDGANGLKTIVKAGGKALVQNPETAYAGAMPASALELCPGAHVFNLQEIAEYLQKAPSL